MDSPESKVHSFIVKLWQEEVGDEADKAFWHGYITHVPGGERRYIKRMNDINDFIVLHLGEMITRPGPEFRFRRWLRRLRLSLMRRP